MIKDSYITHLNTNDGIVLKHLILFIFILHMIILTYLNNTYIAGFPVRSYILVLGGILVAFEGSTYFTDLKLLNVVYTILGVFGIAISLFNHVSIPEILSGSIRMFQSWLIIVCAYYLIIQFNYKIIVYTVLLVAIPSAIIGILQYIDIGFAWKIRELLGSLQNTEASLSLNANFIENRLRPPGLTLFAITQSYLLITAISLSLLVFVRKQQEGESVFIILLAIIILFAGIVASETRSAIGASALLIVLTLFITRPTATVFLSILLSVILLGAQAYIADNRSSESRALNFEDQSAKGRATLYKYGVELAAKRPIGYGYGFNSKEMAKKYFINNQNWFNYAPEEKAHFLVAVHNALLNITHTFGLLGLLMFGIYIFNLAKPHWFFVLVLTGYLIHSFFHNAGILAGDLYIDVFIAIILYYKYQVEDKKPPVNNANQPYLATA